MSFEEQGKDDCPNSIFFDENRTARAILVDTGKSGSKYFC